MHADTFGKNGFLGIMERGYRSCFELVLLDHFHMPPVRVWASNVSHARRIFDMHFPGERVGAITCVRSRTEAQFTEACVRIFEMSRGKADYDSLPGDFT